jgi:hypothetical protein
MKKLNITPGKAISTGSGAYVNGRAATSIEVDWLGSRNTVAYIVDEFDGGEGPANATLYADAHNTYHATGMLPSEMAERIKQLEDALRNLVASWDKNTHRQEEFKTSEIISKGYWSPAAAMVDSEHIAHARALLTPINKQDHDTH